MVDHAAAYLEGVDPDFVKDFLRSDSAVWQVVLWIGQSYAVSKWPAVARPNVEQRAAYRDAGDLFVLCDTNDSPYRRTPKRGDGIRFVPVGVKGRNNLDFTGPDDYPYDTVMVDVVHLWDEAVVKPVCYVIVNRARSHAAIVAGDTSQAWERVELFDPNCQRWRVYYMCPKELVEWAEVARDPFDWEWTRGRSRM